MNWNRINSLIASRKVYLYGRSEDWVHKAIAKLDKKPEAIIDKDTAYENTLYLGIKVAPFEKLNLPSDAFIVITAGDYEGIIQFLEDNKFHENSHFVISPDFSSYKELTNLRDYKQDILITCSDYNDLKRARSSRKGGGLYLLSIPEGSLSKVQKGSFRQLTKFSEGYLTVDYVEKKLIHFSNNLLVKKEINLPYPNSCGICINEEKERIYIANSGKDLIEIYSLDSYEKINEITLTSSDCLSKPGGHHINDLYFLDGMLYFSYFSKMGKWKMGLLDGGLSYIDSKDLDTRKVIKIESELVSNLTKPHSPFIKNTSIRVLDSLTGKLVEGNKTITTFPGFVRGIDQNNNYTFIAMSEDMYVAERKNTESTMLNSGVYVLNESINAYRFYPTQGIMNIHSILLT